MRIGGWIFIFCSFLFLPFSVQAKRFACVRKNNAVAQVANKPKRSYSSIRTIKFNKFTPLIWTGRREGRWYEVETLDDKLAWIRGRDISFSSSCIIVRVDKTRLRTGPGNKYKKAWVAQKGDAFLSLGGEDGWTQVQDADGNFAWMNIEHMLRPERKVRLSFTREK